MNCCNLEESESESNVNGRCVKDSLMTAFKVSHLQTTGNYFIISTPSEVGPDPAIDHLVCRKTYSIDRKSHQQLDQEKLMIFCQWDSGLK